MKRVLVSLILLCSGVSVLAEEIKLDKVEAQKIEIPKTDVKMKDSIVINDKAVMEEIIKLQKEKEI